MRSRFVSILALACASALSLTACGLQGTGGDEEDPGTTASQEEAPSDEGNGELSGEITFTTLQLSPTFDDYINGLVSDFEDLHPETTVRWIDVPFEGAAERLLADATAGELADVINLNPDLAYPLATDGQFINLEEAAADVKDDYIEGAWDSFRYPGQDGAYGYPWYLGTQVMFYNQNILEEAGLDTEDLPETFDELHAMARQIAETTDNYSMFPALEDQFVITLRKLGVDIANEDLTEATFNTPEAVAYVTELRELTEMGAISRDAVTQTHREEIDAYQAGNLAFFMRGPSFLNIVAENAPDLAAASLPGPQIIGPAELTGMSVMGLFVPETTQNRELALAFAEFVTNGENQLAFANTTPIFPSIEAVVADDSFIEAAEDAPVQDAMRIAAEQLPRATNLRPVYVDAEVNNAIIQHVQGALLGQTDPEEALAAAEAEVTEILQRRADR